MPQKLKMSALITISVLSISSIAEALTPQKYCESLAATSCELLNIDINSGSMDSSASFAAIANIKFCRNQVFKTVTYELVTDSSTTKQAPAAADNTNKRRLRVFNNTANNNYLIDAHLDNSLCTQTFLFNGTTVDVLP